jgi:alkylation response protein AidB-like acyl-CoA dehydrogenase
MSGVNHLSFLPTMLTTEKDSLAAQTILASRTEALAAARALWPRLHERARRAEADRVVPRESIHEIAVAGLFGVVTPRVFGGSELGFATLVEVTAEIASACGSTGWVYGVLAGHSWLLNLFPVQAQREIFADPYALTATVFRLGGQVERVTDGFRLTGAEGRFCSGVDHARWIIVGCPVSNPQGAPEPHFFVLPREEFEIIDDWFTAGMRGTGSRSIRARECFIPEHRALSVQDMAGGTSPGARFHGAPIYRMPFHHVSPFSLVGAPLGMARAAVRTFGDALHANIQKMPDDATGGRAVTLARLARSAAEIDAAYALAIDDAAWLDAAAGPEAFDDSRRARFPRDWAYAAQTARGAVNRVFEAAGGSGIYDTSELQRIWRDVNSAAQHFAFTWDTAMNNFGRALVGLPLAAVVPRGGR